MTSCNSFSKIQCAARWAGSLGLVQALIWIGLSIVSILAYCCVIPIDSHINYGSITKFVFFQLYFRGECEPSVYYSDGNFAILDTVSTVFDAKQILIWTCVYLSLSVVWLISSILLLSHVKEDNINVTSGVLYIWASVTLIVCCMDLTLGVIFGIDYSQFQSSAYNYNLVASQAGHIEPNAVQLISGQIAAIGMMIISLKGFVLWVINLGMLIFVFIAAFSVQNSLIENNFINNNHTFNIGTNSVLTTRPPINAYEPKMEVAFDNAAFVVEERKTPVELNEESINRAARMSTDNLQERRFRNIDNFEQYPPQRSQQQPQQVQKPPQVQLPVLDEPPFPAPDYTPPMPRANQNGQLRNTRYQ